MYLMLKQSDDPTDVRPHWKVSKGLWNAWPIMPAARWGMAFARKAPPKKYAKSRYQRMMVPFWSGNQKGR